VIDGLANVISWRRTRAVIARWPYVDERDSGRTYVRRVETVTGQGRRPRKPASRSTNGAVSGTDTSGPNISGTRIMGPSY
jgi:hypothetical protein